MKFCFVILHYKNLKDTLECIESIKAKITCNDYKIIVVDNNSNDDSTVYLKKVKDSKVEFIFSDENLGFAKGNNLGCSYAITKYHPKFLIVINNDTLIIQNDFLERIENKYKKNKFHILGPYIEGKDLKPQNPYLNVIVGKNAIIKNLLKIRIYIILEKFNLNFIRNIFKKYKKEVDFDFNIERNNIALMGAALIFSEDYYKKYDEVFYSKTFMYCEEDILYYFVQKDNLISIYDPTIKIFHKEESTTLKLNKSTKQQKLFKMKNQIDSLKRFLKLIRKSR